MSRKGLTIDLWISINNFKDSMVILSAEDIQGRGFSAETGKNQTIAINLSDGEHNVRWSCDSGLLKPDRRTTLCSSSTVDPKY